MSLGVSGSRVKLRLGDIASADSDAPYQTLGLSRSETYAFVGDLAEATLYQSRGGSCKTAWVSLGEAQVDKVTLNQTAMNNNWCAIVLVLLFCEAPTRPS